MTKRHVDRLYNQIQDNKALSVNPIGFRAHAGGSMKLKLKLAIEAVKERDLIKNENNRFYGEGFLKGFDKALEIAKTLVEKEAEEERNILKKMKPLTWEKPVIVRTDAIAKKIAVLGDEEVQE